MADPFILDTQIEGDCFVVADLDLCRVLLMNDARFPWLILVPRVNGLRELADLERAQQHQLFDEVGYASAALRQLGPFDKLNVAALGNVVAQLHIHVVARRIGDQAWPAPVWGHGHAQPYDDVDSTLAVLRRSLA